MAVEIRCPSSEAIVYSAPGMKSPTWRVRLSAKNSRRLNEHIRQKAQDAFCHIAKPDHLWDPVGLHCWMGLRQQHRRILRENTLRVFVQYPACARETRRRR